MNLLELNIEELTTQETQEVNGGMIPAYIAMAGAAFYFGWELGREYARNH